MIVKNYLNYIGSKDRYLPQILNFIEDAATKLNGSSTTLIDMFCGSAVVGLNASQYVGNVLCVDACKELITLHKWVQSALSSDALLAEIDMTIAQYGLSKENKVGFLRLRKDYNEAASVYNAINPRWLFCLITHAFNYSLHTNKKGEFNAPFGKDRSSFNKVLRKKLINWKEALDEASNVNFEAHDFNDYRRFKRSILFVDPPYSASISKHPYRVGGIKWTEEEDRKLFEYLDYMNKGENLFIFTNVIENNGAVNLPLKNWIKENKYICTPVEVSYEGCNYQRKNNGKTKEVIITNFKKGD